MQIKMEKKTKNQKKKTQNLFETFLM